MPKYTFTIESPAVSSDGGQGVGEGAYGSKDRAGYERCVPSGNCESAVPRPD